MEQSTYPRALDYSKVVSNFTYRTTEDQGLTVQPYFRSVGIYSLLKRWPGVEITFQEFRLKKVKITMVPRYPFGDPGVKCVVCLPMHMSPFEDGTHPEYDFEDLASLTGSTVTRIPEVVTMEYFPTSPFEKNWFSFSDTDVDDSYQRHFVIAWSTVGMLPTSDVHIQLIFDSHIEVRGKGKHGGPGNRSSIEFIHDGYYNELEKINIKQNLARNILDPVRSEIDDCESVSVESDASFEVVD